MKILMSTAVLGGLLIFATPLFAQTYQYVDTSNNLRLTIADTPGEAIAQAPERNSHSGVMEVGTDGVGGEGNAFTPIVTADSTASADVYAYVTVTNSIGTIAASNPTEAIVSADNRMSNSGVILVEEIIEE